MTASVGVEPRPLSLRLREGTREAHEQVERAADFNRLIVVRIPVAEGDSEALAARARDEYREVYRRFLIAACGFEAAVNDALTTSPARAAAIASGYAAEPADPVTLIRDDLREVFGGAALEELRPMAGLPAAESLATFAGIEYVRRGSRAGGAVIAAVVEANLGLTRDRGASFLAQYGKQTRAVLVALREWLDSLPLSETQAREAVDSAAATFAAVERWHLRIEGALARA